MEVTRKLSGTLTTSLRVVYNIDMKTLREFHAEIDNAMQIFTKYVEDIFDTRRGSNDLFIEKIVKEIDELRTKTKQISDMSSKESSRVCTDENCKIGEVKGKFIDLDSVVDGDGGRSSNTYPHLYERSFRS